MKKTITKTVALSLLALVGLNYKADAQYSVLYNCTTASGAYPRGDLYSDGTYLYGMASYGGANSKGDIFKIKPDGTGYTDLLDFNGTNGSGPQGSLISDGTFLYGMAGGGANNKGLVFKIKPDGTGYVDLLDFNTTNGEAPQGSLLYDGTFLYGMTKSGGSGGNGNIFKIKTDGTGYANLLSFVGTNGSLPQGSLISDGTFLYGMTVGGDAAHSSGTIFKIKTDGTGYTDLYDFTGAGTTGTGLSPYGSLFFDGTFLYGMTYGGGGANNDGVIFKIKPDGTGYTILLSFNGTNGKYPYGSLISDGTYLYGMTFAGVNFGNIFKIKTDGTDFVDMYDFDATHGDEPYGSLISDGIYLYGVANGGGSSYIYGVIFKLAMSSVGIQKYDKQNLVSLYPNPAANQLTIETDKYTNANLEIFNMQGQLVQSEILQSSKTIVQVCNLSSGVYFVKVKNTEGVSIQKFIKE